MFRKKKKYGDDAQSAEPPCVQAIRKLFLSEDVFAELARLYGFPDKIIITPKTSLQHLRYNPTVLGDAFEAMVGAIDEEAAREGRQHILQWVAKLFSTDVFPTLVEVGVERNKYLKGRRAAAKEKIAKEEQRRLEEARKKDAQRDRVLDGGVAAHQYPPSRMGKSRPNPRRRRAGLARPPDAEPEWKRQRLAQVSSAFIPHRERVCPG